MMSRISILAVWACASAACNMSPVVPFYLDVHLQCGDSVPGSRDFEVHVTEVIFITRISVRTAKRSPSRTSPMAIPATLP